MLAKDVTFYYNNETSKLTTSKPSIAELHAVDQRPVLSREPPPLVTCPFVAACCHILCHKCVLHKKLVANVLVASKEILLHA